MSFEGWTLAGEKKKKKPIVQMVDVPRCEFVEWDEDARDLFVIMREMFPKCATAEDLSKLLNAKRKCAEFNKMNVGDLLYGDELNPYVTRCGKPPNRVWRVRQVSD